MEGLQLALASMAVPFLACLVLTGIHVYLGIHVIERKVIFVDLALATIAALGAVAGALLGWDVHGDVWVIKGFSLAFTTVGAAVFSITRMRHERVPHEAIIGIVYAVALAAIILGSARLPHGAEEVRDLQAGSILWVEGSTIAWTALLYAGVGAFHFAFRRRFFALSLDPARAEAEGIHMRLWDFLFYVSFGFVVTSSVSIAGVLLVFSYLVIPAVIAILFADGIAARLTIGWIVGALVSAIGVLVSYYADLPSGPLIVVSFGIALALAGLVHHVRRSPARLQALARIATGLAILAGLAWAAPHLRKREELDVAHVLEAGSTAERLQVLARTRAEPELWSAIASQVPALLAAGPLEVRLGLVSLIGEQGRAQELDAVLALLEDPDDVVREQALACVRRLDLPESAAVLARIAPEEPDDYIKVEMAEALLEMDDPRGIPILLDVMDRGEAREARRDAYEHLTAHVEPRLSYHAERSHPEHAAEVAAWRQWWETNRDGLRLTRGDPVEGG